MAQSEYEAILFNLLSNSVRALDRPSINDRRILVSVTESDGQVRLRFLDSGIGIDDDLRERVFEAFVTTSGADDIELGFGTGLGINDRG